MNNNNNNKIPNLKALHETPLTGEGLLEAVPKSVNSILLNVFSKSLLVRFLPMEQLSK